MFSSVTPRKIVKTVTRVAVYAGSIYGTEAALNAIIGDSESDETSPSIHTGSLLIGTMVGYQVSLITDAVIEVAADRRIERKNEETDESPLVAVS